MDPIEKTARALVERSVRHPEALRLGFADGVLQISGVVEDHEAAPLLRRLRTLPGVRALQETLEVVHPAPDEKSEGAQQFHYGYEPGYIEGHWPDSMRALLGALGAWLMLRGFRRPSAFRTAGAALGLALASRAAFNRDIAQLVGSIVLPVIRVRRQIRVAAPVDRVFRFWSDFETFSQFMSFIRSVRANAAGGLHWKAQGPLAIKLSWDTTVLCLDPDREIAWRSVPGALIATAGRVRFKSEGSHACTLNIELSWAPPFGVLGWLTARIIGFDPAQRFDRDLGFMRRLLEESYESSPERPLREAEEFSRSISA